MDKKSKNPDEKIDRATTTFPSQPTKDRGDLTKSLLTKVFEELDIMDFLQARDRGDSKPVRKRYNNQKPPIKEPKISIEKKKAEDNPSKTVPAKKEKREEPNDFAIRELCPKTINKAIEKKKLDDAKAKAALTTRDVKIATEKFEEQHQFLKVIKDGRSNVDEGNKAKSPSILMRGFDKEGQNRTYLDLESRKRIRERYTVKLKNNQNSNKNIDSKDNFQRNATIDERDVRKQTDEEIGTSQSLKGVNQTETSKPDKKPKEPSQVQRKPVVKTIRLNNDNRVYKDYKTVTFFDQKECTPLQINIPNDCGKDKKSAESNTVATLKPVTSKSSVRICPVKKYREKRRVLKKRSPVVVSNRSPPLTEVAKWAPSCEIQQNKRYYEAWVDTKLTSVSKCTEEDEIFLKKHSMIQTFKRALELVRSRSPAFVCDEYHDEKYTGRITVKRSNVK